MLSGRFGKDFHYNFPVSSLFPDFLVFSLSSNVNRPRRSDQAGRSNRTTIRHTYRKSEAFRQKIRDLVDEPLD